MQRYLVGGAVRDQLLGLPVRERDWVVVGASADMLLAEGFLQVGRDFPVFLHPVTREEYALARTERKTGQGHGGFVCRATPHITLEQDLLRRDLTINAMARADDGTLIDPYQGQQDVQQRWLRHVSPAFAEDPLRVLRVARFSAYYAKLGFRIAPETVALMRTMAAGGELQHLSPERVWQESEKALCSSAPQRYFTVLRDSQVLPIWFPELANLFGVPAPVQWHPEIDSGVHTLMALEQAAQLGHDLAVRFAVLCHDFGKALTPKEWWPHHPHHGRGGFAPINAFCSRLRVPNALRELALLVSKVHCSIHRAQQLTSEQLLALLDTLDVWRRPQRLSSVLLACIADARGRKGMESAPYPQAGYLENLVAQLSLVSWREGDENGLSGSAVGAALRQRRLQRLQQLI